MTVVEHIVSHRNGSQVMVAGLKLLGMGYIRGARVRVSDPAGDPAKDDWVFDVPNDEHATLVCRDPPPPAWLQPGTRVRIEVSPPANCLTPATPPPVFPAGRNPVPVHSLASPHADRVPRGSPATPGVRGTGPVLCIGLDIAWFGGSEGNRDSQFDCLAWALLNHHPDQCFNLTAHLERVALDNRDLSASQLLNAIEALLQRHDAARSVVFAIDAPVQASHRDHLPARVANPPPGTIERRACENYLSQERQRIDGVAGGANNWHPNIQPGAPLAPRVRSLLAGLDKFGFRLWTEAARASERLVIECFPAEAIWAMKRLNRFDTALTAAEVKSYKGRERQTITAQQVVDLTLTVLNGFALDSGHSAVWTVIVQHAIDWMCSDPTWCHAPGQFRGGKLLDDVVDSLICLATSLSYIHGLHHVWQDPNRPDDGHIIGPGNLAALR